jgi:hypothetical protein
MAPILACGDAVDGDAFVIFFSGLLAVLGISMHVAGSGRTAHAVPMTVSVPPSDPDYSRSARAMRDASADVRLIV